MGKILEKIKPRPRPGRAAKKLWKCPECGRGFASRNQQHSCGRYTVAGFLEGKGPRAKQLFDKFAGLVRSCGPVELAPAKTRVGFQVRMIFAAVNALSDRWLDGHVVLSRRMKNPRFLRVESLSPRCHVHHFRIRSLEELDGEVLRWLKESYRVGEQRRPSR